MAKNKFTVFKCNECGEKYSKGDVFNESRFCSVCVSRIAHEKFEMTLFLRCKNCGNEIEDPKPVFGTCERCETKIEKDYPLTETKVSAKEYCEIVGHKKGELIKSDYPHSGCTICYKKTYRCQRCGGEIKKSNFGL